MDRDEASAPSVGDSSPQASPQSAGADLSWPPPGLAALQGGLWRIVVLLAIGDIVLILPLLWSLTKQQPLWSVGPFGTTWWLPMASTGLGLVILSLVFGRLHHFLSVSGWAAKQGHSLHTILLVAVDAPADAGFLIQGVRTYSKLTPKERGILVRARLLRAGASLAATIWIPLAFVASILLASRGLLGPTGVWRFTIGPAVLLIVAAVVVFPRAYLLNRSVRRDREARDTAEEELSAEVSQWNDRLVRVSSDHVLVPGSSVGQRAFRYAAAGTIVMSAAIVIPLLTLMLTGVIASTMAAMSLPNFGELHRKITSASVLRRYRLAPDPAITAEAAGAAVHSLLYSGHMEQPAFPMQAPVRTYEQEWLSAAEAEAIQLADDDDWATKIIQRARDGFEPAELAHLREVAARPAHQELETVALASSADIIGTRYVLPFPDTLLPFDVTLPPYRGIRRAAQAHVAKAALELSEGRPEQAERSLREVISAGFVLIDEGPLLIESLMGTLAVNMGGDALEELYRVTGRHDEAEDLRWVREEARRVADSSFFTDGNTTLEGGLWEMSELALDDKIARGMRWEFFMMFRTLERCSDLHGLVFGGGRPYEYWLERARQSLVRRPSDEELFGFLQRPLAAANTASFGWLGAINGIIYGSEAGWNSCGPGLGDLSL